MTPAEIEQLIESGLPGSEARVRSDDGTHFEAVIVSGEFTSKTTLQQHRLIYQVLGEKIGTEIHALSIRTYTPDTWRKETTTSDPQNN